MTMVLSIALVGLLALGSLVVAGPSPGAGASPRAATAVFPDLACAVERDDEYVGPSFGTSISVSGDLVAVGAPCETAAGFAYAGLVDVFNASSGGFERTIQSPDAQYYGQFGTAVALSGHLLLVGAPAETSSPGFGRTGQSYVFNAVTGALVETLKPPGLRSGLTSVSGGEFGETVALSGNVAVVGAPQDPASGFYEGGLAFVFNATNGTKLATLEDPQAALDGSDEFGLALATTGTVTVVGEPDYSVLGPGGYVPCGAAYLFNPRTGALLQDLTPPGITKNEAFGDSVAISHDIAVVGAQGESIAYAYFTGNGSRAATYHDPWPDTDFANSLAASGGLLLVGGSALGSAGSLGRNVSAHVFDLTNGRLLQNLTSPDYGLEVATSDQGLAWPPVTLSGDRAFLGAIDSAITAYGTSGRVYGFNATAGTLDETLASPPTDLPYLQGFGGATAVNGSVAVIGAPGTPVRGAVSAGAAYVVNTTSGSVERRLLSPNAQAGGEFGASVAIDGSVAIIGAPGEEVGASPQAGNAYVFDVTSGALLLTLSSPSPQGGGGFGTSVALNGRLLIIGAPYEDDSGRAYAGHAYVYHEATGALAHALKDRATAVGDGTYFGFSVAVDGGSALVGVPGQRLYGLDEVGAVQIFGAGNGTFLRNLTGPKSLEPSVGYLGDEWTGFSLAASGPDALVGSPGAYVAPCFDCFGDFNGSAELFDIATGAVRLNLTGGTDSGYDAGFGRSVGLSGDLAVVGAPNQLHNATSQISTGNATVFRTSTGAILPAPSRLHLEDEEEFGASVAVDGRTIVVGAPDSEGGHATVYQAPTEALRRDVADPAVDYYGYAADSVAVSGGRSIEGDHEASPGGQAAAGSAELLNSTSGAVLRTLGDPNSQAEGSFGFSVAIDAVVAAVGAPYETAGGETEAGHVYVYDPRSGALLQTLADPVHVGESYFGYSVAVWGDRVIVGAPGGDAAYVFNAGTGGLLHTFTGSPGIGSLLGFGASVALSGTTALVGDPDATVAGLTAAGNASEFRLASGALQRNLTSAHPQADGGFGSAVGLSGTAAIVGAPFETVAGSVQAGNVYLFRVPSGHRLPSVVNPFVQEYAQFGAAVALNGTRAIIGALDEFAGDEPPLNGSSQYAVVVNVTTGAAVQYLIDPYEYYEFGISVSISGTFEMVGYETGD
jgi:hypothetical protein